jgi:hypothetical protein
VSLTDNILIFRYTVSNRCAAIFFIVVVCAIGFPLIFVVAFDPYLQELIIGGCFSIGALFTMCIYFGPKLSLLLSGADLNNKFQIVNKSKDKKDVQAKKQAELLAAAEAEAEAEKARQYLLSVPKDAEACEAVINFLQGELYRINLKAQQGSGFSGSSGAASGNSGGSGASETKGGQSIAGDTGRASMMTRDRSFHSTSKLVEGPLILGAVGGGVVGGGGGSPAAARGKPFRALPRERNESSIGAANSNTFGKGDVTVGGIGNGNAINVSFKAAATSAAPDSGRAFIARERSESTAPARKDYQDI